MNEIQELTFQRFKLVNVSPETKQPIDKWGNPLTKWEQKTADDLRGMHNYKANTCWGMIMGLQDNGRRIMSIDFDICGDKDRETGQRLGCPIAKEAFEDIFRNVDEYDGFYSSSTKGNYNVLVDYTHCESIIDLLDTLGKNKFKYGAIEFLINNVQQVIPPSMTKCKISGRCENQREWLNDNHFWILKQNDYIYNFLYEKIKEKVEKSKKESPISTPKPYQASTDNEPEKTPTTDKYVELLFCYMNSGSLCWADWFHIAGILKYNYDYEVGRRLFINYSKIRKDDEYEPAMLFDSLKKSFPMSIYGLQSLAKKMNPFGYSEWLLKHKEYISLKILDKGENDVAKFISKHLYGKLIYDNKNWWVCDSSGLWRITKSPFAIFTNHIQHLIDESKKSLLYFKGISQDKDHIEKCEKFEKKYTIWYREVGKNSFTNQIEKFLKEYLLIPNFTSTLDNYKYQIVFKNGIYDLKTLFFRPNIYSTDYISKCLPFDWEEPTQYQVEWMNTELKKICNWNDSHLAYYKSMFGYAFTGDANKLQTFFYLQGQKASNGKSTILEALQSIMPLYVGKASSNAFDENNAKVHKDIATWDTKRIMWANELTTKPKDAELLKAIGDGTTIPYDKLYDTKQDMSVDFKLFMISKPFILYCNG
jgi:hypothetical protein